MTNRRCLLGLLLMLASLLTHPAFARNSDGGGEVGNGSDDVPEEYRSAWFLGKGRTIRVCFIRSEEFGVPTETAEQALQSAFQQWIGYIEKRKFTPTSSSDGWKFADRLEISPACAGSQDLTIYLGAESPVVKDAAEEFSNPLAFTKRI